MPTASCHDLPLLAVLERLAVPLQRERRRSDVERLSSWLDLSAALELYALLQTSAAASIRISSCEAGGGEAMVAEVEQIRSRLKAACTAADHTSGFASALHEALQQAVASADHAPLQRYHVLQQRTMATHIAGLRQRVRQLLQQSVPALQQLAAFDAVLGQGFSAREEDLLARLPQLLAARFGELLRSARDEGDLFAHHEADPQPSDQVWLSQLGKEVEQMLHAEIDFRLMPVVALLDAYREQVNGWE